MTTIQTTISNKGVGNQLHYYHSENAATGDCAPVVVLADVLVEHIHGISVVPIASGHHRIVCHGGKEIVQLVLHGNHLTRCQPNKTIHINDWISSIHLYENADELAVLTAHGVAVRMRLDWMEVDDGRIVDTANCPDKSTLYCSLILEEGNGWTETTFFGGTAFGELIVWRCLDGSPVVQLRMDCHNVSNLD